MELASLKPTDLIETLVNKVEQQIYSTNKENHVISEADYNHLPSYVKNVVDTFKREGKISSIKADDLLAAFRTDITQKLQKSLDKGTLLPKDGQKVAKWFSIVPELTPEIIEENASLMPDSSNLSELADMSLKDFYNLYKAKGTSPLYNAKNIIGTLIYKWHLAEGTGTKKSGKSYEIDVTALKANKRWPGDMAEKITKAQTIFAIQAVTEDFGKNPDISKSNATLYEVAKLAGEFIVDRYNKCSKCGDCAGGIHGPEQTDSMKAIQNRVEKQHFAEEVFKQADL